MGSRAVLRGGVSHKYIETLAPEKLARKGGEIMLDVRSALRRAMVCNRNRPAILAEDFELTFEEAWKRGCQLANARSPAHPHSHLTPPSAISKI